MSNQAEVTCNVPFTDTGMENSVETSLKTISAIEISNDPSQLVQLLPDGSENYTFLGFSLSADGSLAISSDLSDDLKDIDIQPIFPGRSCMMT